ncbi:MAG: hypothetical protein HY978_02505 [Candidatus Liptonbacteria bacterium]|nr:hypothetical protein [Candidatus Liptonbacteria bacterium]
MSFQELIRKIQEIVANARALKDKRAGAKNARVNYACIFSQNNKEEVELMKVAGRVGNPIRDAPTGPLFQIQPIPTKTELNGFFKARMWDARRASH